MTGIVQPSLTVPAVTYRLSQARHLTLRVCVCTEFASEFLGAPCIDTARAWARGPGRTEHAAGCQSRQCAVTCAPAPAAAGTVTPTGSGQLLQYPQARGLWHR